MTATQTIKTQEGPIQSREERLKRLVDIADRDSLRRDFEIVRERHGLPKKQSPPK